MKKFIGNEDDGAILNNVSFSGDELILTSTLYGEPSVETYSNFHWEGLSFTVRDDSEKSKISGFEKVNLSFETNDKHYMSLLKKERLFNWFDIFIPSDKIKSIERAFLRLKEIAQ